MEFSLAAIAEVDQSSLRWVERKRTRWLTPALAALTVTGTWPAWAIMALFLNLLQNCHIDLIPRQSDFLKAMICPLFAWGGGRLMKRAFGRKRPIDRMVGFTVAAATPNCNSLPSSHAASTFSFALALLWIHHPLAPLALAWASVVTFSRFYLGVHFPTDLLAGTLWGAVCSLAVLQL